VNGPYPIVEPISPEDLVSGEIYYAVQFLDDELTVPSVEPIVFVGWDHFGDERVRTAYFQTAETYSRGVRLETTTADDPADFLCAEEDELSYIFNFEGLVESISATAHRRLRLQQR
jgi:hypothetical protein